MVDEARPETMSLTNLVREVGIAVAMIALLIGGLFLHTGTMPPLVVVESSSMVHDERGEIGSIDAGDLILVHGRAPAGIVTFAEATHAGHPSFGHASHGMEGDVVIYEKNGEQGTPIIHRAILWVLANATTTPDRAALAEAGHMSDEPHSQEPSDDLACPQGGAWDPTVRDADGGMGTCILTWDVPGTPVRNQSTVSIQFDGVEAGYYDCKRPAHGNAEAHLVVHEWEPTHEGLLTLGDANRCSVDQGPSATNGSAGVHGQGGVVEAIRTDWVIGRAGAEIPWLGTLKLALSSSGPGAVYVPNSSYIGLIAVVGAILALPLVVDPVVNRIFTKSPEREEAKRERAMDVMLSALSEDE